MLNFNQRARFSSLPLQIQCTFSNTLCAAKFKPLEPALEKCLLMVYFISVKFTYRNLHRKALVLLNVFKFPCRMNFNVLFLHH